MMKVLLTMLPLMMQPLMMRPLTTARLPRPALVALLCSFVSSTALASPPLKFAPHEAEYELHLDQNRPNSQVLRADGKLLFTLTDGCDGWTTDQKMEIKFLYAQGQQATITVQTSSWEANDGSSYTFSSRTLNNGKETEAFRGKASLSAAGGEASYSLPKGKTLKIAAGAIFPNQHTILILQRALAGEKVPNQQVFDGTDDKALSDVSVFLGKPQVMADDKTVPEKLRREPLLQGQAWATHLAFFPVADKPNKQPDDEMEAIGTPDYELKLDLLANSVARGLLIDYGNFTVRGTINRLKSLPESGCTPR